MYKGRTRFLISIFAIFAMATLALISPIVSNDSSAEADGRVDGADLILTYGKDKEITINADDSVTIPISVLSNYSMAKHLAVKATTDVSGVSASVALSSSRLNPSSDPTNPSLTDINLTIHANKYAHQGEYNLTLLFTVSDYYEAPNIDGTFVIPFKVESNLSASEQYNRFMGIWDNNLPAPFDDAWFAALVTGIAWILIGCLVGLIVVPIILNIIMKNEDDRKSMKHALVRMCLIIIILNGISKAIRVLGVGEDVIDFFDRIFYICYILASVVVLWHVYLIVINWLVKRIGVKDFIPGGSKSDFESLKPLLVYIGEIVFAVATIGSIMNLLGFNMTAIITSAGIVSLGITMGAQSVLSQFFSGLVILATRPFKAGDMITLNGGSVTYRVKKINVMYTEFENWDNTDITIIPNSALTSGIVKNITRETLKSKVHIFMDVAYGTDLAYARATMLEVANSNPRIIKDGSVGRPSTRVVDFLDSNIRLRLSAYVDDFNDSGSIGGELRQALYNKFNERGIDIDYTQIVVHSAVQDKEESKD